MLRTACPVAPLLRAWNGVGLGVPGLDDGVGGFVAGGADRPGELDRVRMPDPAGGGGLALGGPGRGGRPRRGRPLSVWEWRWRGSPGGGLRTSGSSSGTTRIGMVVVMSLIGGGCRRTGTGRRSPGGVGGRTTERIGRAPGGGR